MNIVACSISGCEKKHYARTWCRAHYVRWKRHGDPTGGLKVLRGEERFWIKVSKTDSCWNWIAAIDAWGYGWFASGGLMKRAHRVSYEMHNGPILEGAQIDHICRNPKCVNPEHLRQVTNKQNQENHGGPTRASTSGVRGVTWHSKASKWRASVMHHGEFYDLGLFTNLDDAEVAVTSKRNELFTHNDQDRICV